MLEPLMGCVRVKQTNNRAELTAILKFIEASIPTNRPLHIHTDSQYSLYSISKFCRMTDEQFDEAIPWDKVLNLDIIKSISDSIREKQPHRVFISKEKNALKSLT